MCYRLNIQLVHSIPHIQNHCSTQFRTDNRNSFLGVSITNTDLLI
nr:MAG TPA: hypothetical protein [Caudoviricetes sp.]